MKKVRIVFSPYDQENYLIPEELFKEWEKDYKKLNYDAFYKKYDKYCSNKKLHEIDFFIKH